MSLSPRSVSLRVLAFAAIGALSLSACGGEGGPDDTAGSGGDSAIKVALFPSYNALGARAADEEGIFKEEGLDAELVTIATPAEGTPQLLGGKIDIALMDVTTPVIARSQNVPLVMVAPGAVGTAIGEDGFGTGNFWVAKNSKIKSIKDIENATFGVPQTKSQITVDIRTVVDEAGGDSSKIKFVEVPNTIAALKNGSVDVITTAEPSGTKAKGDKDIQHLSGFVSGGVGEVAYVYVATEDYVQKNKDKIAKFQDAIIAANKKLNSTDGLPAKIAGTYIEAPQDLLDKSSFQKFSESPLDEKVVNQGIDRVVRYDLIKKEDAPSPADLLAE